MPIMKRISDPYGDDIKRLLRERREGKPPPPPRKPTYKERQPFIRDLKAVPVGKRFERGTFMELVIDKYINKTYDIWGQAIYLYPDYMSLNEGFTFDFFRSTAFSGKLAFGRSSCDCSERCRPGITRPGAGTNAVG